MDGQIDVGCLGIEDLQEEYLKLKDRYNQLLIVSEKDTQRIYELRRSLETAAAAEAYLSQELEQLTLAQASQNDTILFRKQSEVDDLKKRQSVLLAENEELHQDVADLRAENACLNQKLKELTEAAQSVETAYQIPKEHLELKERLEAENLELLAQLDESHECVISFTMKLADKEKQIELLKDQVFCLEENLQSKRDEVEEKSQLLESAQEQIVEMNGKIAMLTSAPANDNRKGNSLFAEVDDQRQAMKQLLAAQKKSYLHMKKVFHDSQYEIRRLKRENAAMHNELQACTTIFCSADKTYKEKLNERIIQLMKQNEELEKKLTVTQQELVSLGNDKGVAWLDSMLLFCKQETEELKRQLHSTRIQKGILEERLRNSQQDLAKWRFESLKSRCVIIDRETLLTDNNIGFKTFTNRDVSFAPSLLDSVTPNIGLDIQQNRGTRNNSRLIDDQKMNTNKKRTRNENDKTPTKEVSKSLALKSDSIGMESKQHPDVITKILSTNTTPFPRKDEENEAEQNPCTRQTALEDVIADTKPVHCSQTGISNETKRPMGIKTEPLSPSQTSIIRLNNLEIACTTDQDKDVKPIHTIGRENNTKSQIDILTDTITVPNILSPSQKSKILFNNLKIEVTTVAKEDKENVRETETAPNLCAKQSDHVELKPRPSILTTKKDILGNEIDIKSVHFSLSEASSDDCQKPKFISKSTRTKSNFVVRRIILKPKNKAALGEGPTVPQ